MLSQLNPKKIFEVLLTILLISFIWNNNTNNTRIIALQTIIVTLTSLLTILLLPLLLLLPNKAMMCLYLIKVFITATLIVLLNNQVAMLISLQFKLQFVDVNNMLSNTIMQVNSSTNASYVAVVYVATLVALMVDCIFKMGKESK